MSTWKYLDVRIIGLAPLQEDRDEVTGQLTGGFSPLFWVHFREIRPVLVKAEVFNLVKNDAERRTYDDIFWKRMFGSTIVQESNVMNRKVKGKILLIPWKIYSLLFYYFHVLQHLK